MVPLVQVTVPALVSMFCRYRVPEPPKRRDAPAGMLMGPLAVPPDQLTCEPGTIFRPVTSVPLFQFNTAPLTRLIPLMLPPFQFRTPPLAIERLPLIPLPRVKVPLTV